MEGERCGLYSRVYGGGWRVKDTVYTIGCRVEGDRRKIGFIH
jgi:hypothetical protein